MKILAIPDVHGNKRVLENAKKVFETEHPDKVIFLGDYCDSHYRAIGWKEQKEELEKIMEWKHEVNSVTPGLVETCFGNHDLSYMSKFGGRSCSQFQSLNCLDIQETLEKYFDEFTPLVIVDKWLFSHAGITPEWLEDPCHAGPIFPDLLNMNLDKVKECFRNKELVIFNFNGNDPYGDDSYETCMWIRPPSLIRFGLEGYHQCVGHTALDPETMGYWNLEDRVVPAQKWWDDGHFITWQYENEEDHPRNLDCKYVFLDSPNQEYYAIIDTETDEVKVIKY